MRNGAIRAALGNTGNHGRDMPSCRVTRVERERMLRREVRFMRGATMRVAQWGLTVMIALYTAIGFLRQHVRDQLLGAKQIEPWQALPAYRYILGTLFLAVAALVFSVLMLRSGRILREYVGQLKNCPSGIADPVPTNWTRGSMVFLFFAFPLFDVIVNLCVHVSWGAGSWFTR